MKKIWAALILIVVVFISYAPAVRNGFVWDDTALVLRDPLIRSWRLIPEGFNHFLFVDATASDFYRPIQRLIYTIDYAAFAFRPGPYHLTSVLWHSLAAIALLFFAEELLLSFGLERGRCRLMALVAALVWAIHPVQSAAVAYVSECVEQRERTSFSFNRNAFFPVEKKLGQSVENGGGSGFCCRELLQFARGSRAQSSADADSASSVVG